MYCEADLLPLVLERVEAVVNATKVQEQAVKGLLDGIGFQAVPKRPIPLLMDAPAAGEYCGESKLGDTRADVVIGLFDRRVLAIECKVSNSGTNSNTNQRAHNSSNRSDQ